MTVTLDKRATEASGPPPRPGGLGEAWVWLRRMWRRLTSMRTALVLLFLLAIASVPGSLLPQKPLNPSKVQSYLATHGAYGRILDQFGFFNVFSTPWFAAIYLLLAISLVGCLTPRIRIHLRGVRAQPLPAPRNLARLPESGAFGVAASVDSAGAATRAVLGRRWRTVVREEKDGAIAVSAEKGYLRETGNLIFHVALLVTLAAVAVGKLYGFTASIVVLEGDGFSNQVSQFDSWRPGELVNPTSLPPFAITSLDKFTATYLSTGEPSQFAANVTYTRNVGAKAALEHDRITVNHPLRLEGDRVYLIGHGFAPHVTVRMPNGTVLDDTAAFIPQNPNTYYSEGAFQFQGPLQSDGSHKDDVGIQGFFAPTPAETSAGVFTSTAPVANNPVLGIFVYQGDLGLDGQPRSVYTLDTTKMTKLGAQNLTKGQTYTAPNGVTVTFDGWVQWASMQVSHDPSQGYLLISASAMVLGLILSLAVRRRRVWVRLSPDPAAILSDGPRTVIQVGGLARSDSGNFTEEFAALFKRLQDGVPERSGAAVGSSATASSVAAERDGG